MFRENSIVKLVSLHDPAIRFSSAEEAAAAGVRYHETFDLTSLRFAGAAEPTIYHVRMLGPLDFAELEPPRDTMTPREKAAAKLTIFDRCVVKVTQGEEEINPDHTPPAARFDIASQAYTLHGAGCRGPLS